MLLCVAPLIWVAFQITPPDVFRISNISTAYYATWRLSPISVILAWLREAVYVALGEELFFRGLLGGWLIQELGFTVGNAAQSLAFMLPHLVLLLVSGSLWPFLIVQVIAAWLLGWLRYKSGSILPGFLIHSLGNTWGALQVMT